jgi:transposase
MEVTAIGIDLAKSVFQLHGIDAKGKSVFKKRLSREKMMEFLVNHKPCQLGIEACGGANFFARRFQALGHEVRVMAPQFVKPFVKSNKNDAADAEAISEAMMRPNMRFVSPKSIEQQDIQSIHRVRTRRIAERTALCNEMRGLLSEYGIILPIGINQLRKNLVNELEKARDKSFISLKSESLFLELLEELRGIDERIHSMDDRIDELHAQSEVSKRLVEIPGVGKITSTAIIGSIGNAKNFKNGREFAAFLGLVPKQHSSGGKEKLLGISKRGDSYLRTLLIHGARATIRFLDRYQESHRKKWLQNLIERRGKNKTIVALANKTARQIWVLLATGVHYQPAI